MMCQLNFSDIMKAVSPAGLCGPAECSQPFLNAGGALRSHDETAANDLLEKLRSAAATGVGDSKAKAHICAVEKRTTRTRLPTSLEEGEEVYSVRSFPASPRPPGRNQREVVGGQRGKGPLHTSADRAPSRQASGRAVRSGGPVSPRRERGFRRTSGASPRFPHSPKPVPRWSAPISGCRFGFRMPSRVLSAARLVVVGSGRGCSCDSRSSRGAIEGPRAAPQPRLGLVLEKLRMVMAVMPEDKRLDSNFYGSSWELMVTCAAIFLAVLLFLRRSFQLVRSRLYVGREQNLALKLSALIDEKCKLLEKYCLIQKECEGLALPVKDVKNEMESADTQGLEVIFEDLNQYKSKIEDEILSLEKELKEENSKHAEQDDLMSDLLENIQSLEEESKSLKSKVAEAKMTFKVFQMNEERLKISTKGFLDENCQIQECQTQLLQEADAWKEKLNELDKQKTTFEDTVLHAEQVLTDRENQIQFLTDRLLNMEGWANVLTEDVVDDDNLQLGMKSESEDDAHLDEQRRKALEKLIQAAKLNASLKTMEGERDQIYTDLSEIEKTKDELTEHMKNLETEQSSIQSESTLLENDRQRLQNKLEVMTELYQENEMKLHRKLTVEENCRLEKEEKLCKADEKLSFASEELEIYRKRVKDLEEELERTVLSYQAQITSYEKKAHDNWLKARNVERNLSDLKKENAYNRQKLTETEFKCELLEKDPYAVDVPNTTFGREHSPYGPSPLGRPSSETRAFLSPPTLLEGPLRLSPLLPGGGGRGSRGPGNIVNQQDNTEKGESRHDPHRALSDTGSLSPPWEPDRRRMIPLSGQPYPDPAVPAQMQDRFYSNSGRLSGPSELRSFNRPTFDKADGATSSEMDSGKNDPKDDVNNSNVPESYTFTEREATGLRFVPPPFPPVRSSLLPMDPRGPFIRRGPPFPPPPPGNLMYGPPRDYFPPRNIPGSPYPAVAMRNVCPPRGFPHYLPPRPGFYPTNPDSENRSEFPSGSIPPSNEPTTEHSEPQQAT
ncbi:PREDICTED: cTAGE family member 5 [Elephantulus edwardii]|uniref:cTAGE family member 5 n=1 Tax=Elephantulus edwardii TaxID=28737 RepID=UPI0003F0E2DA|nr:PREDICTED: cTAGE family member 5 [Elephantulus edwardii]